MNNWNHLEERPTFERASRPRPERFREIVDMFEQPNVADDLMVCFDDYYMALITLRNLYLTGASIAQVTGYVIQDNVRVVEKLMAPFELTVGDVGSERVFELSIVGVLNTSLRSNFQVQRLASLGGRPAPLTLLSNWSDDTISPRLLGFSMRFGDIILLPDEENELLRLISAYGFNVGIHCGQKCTKIRYLLARARGAEAEIRGESAPTVEEEEEGDE